MTEYLITLTVLVEAENRKDASELAELMKDELEHSFNGDGSLHISVHDVEING